ncbi:hypothetical protein [Streptomyces sp. NPDC004579]|uniref:hypothetical protein n=1 Tax=Streptomyces sp. NPDC004579 TaxID=3154667 RepID=UPI0033B97B41
MTSELPSRATRRPRAVSAPRTAVYDSILGLLGEQLGEQLEATPAPAAGKPARKVRSVHVEFGDDPRAVHDFAGGEGYSLASNWFTRLLAQLSVANSITKSQLCVFLFVASGQTPGTGVAQFTQQEITDGLNELAAKKDNAKMITRPTVNRAVKALCEYQWIERVGNGRLRLNVSLWFQGSSDAQQTVMAKITEDHKDDADPASSFPNRLGPALVQHHQEALDLSLGGETSAPVRKVRTG